MERSSPADATLAEQTIRGLARAWTEFEARLERAPIVQKLNRGAFRMEDYRALLLNLRQQVIDGGAWIARAASGVSPAHFEIRSHFLRHAVTEHRDFRMLDDNYAAVGGARAEIERGEKNLGSEALSAFMFHRASQPDAFDLLGAMFIIEGLGTRKAREWGEAIRDQLGLDDRQVSFLLYHAGNDADHLEHFERFISEVAVNEAVSARIVKTARTVARLYALQLEEIDDGRR